MKKFSDNNDTGRASKSIAANEFAVVKPPVTGNAPSPSTTLSTGNINIGTGPGAINSGSYAASIKDRRGEIKFNSRTSKGDVPKGGNINIGLGGGADNSGEASATIIDGEGDITF